MFGKKKPLDIFSATALADYLSPPPEHDAEPWEIKLAAFRATSSGAFSSRLAEARQLHSWLIYDGKVDVVPKVVRPKDYKAPKTSLFDDDVD